MLDSLSNVSTLATAQVIVYVIQIQFVKCHTHWNDYYTTSISQNNQNTDANIQFSFMPQSTAGKRSVKAILLRARSHLSPNLDPSLPNANDSTAANTVSTAAPLQTQPVEVAAAVAAAAAAQDFASWLAKREGLQVAVSRLYSLGDAMGEDLYQV